MIFNTSKLSEEQTSTLRMELSIEFHHVKVFMDMLRRGEISQMDTNKDVYERFMKHLEAEFL